MHHQSGRSEANLYSQMLFWDLVPVNLVLEPASRVPWVLGEISVATLREVQDINFVNLLQQQDHCKSMFYCIIFSNFLTDEAEILRSWNLLAVGDIN